MTGIADLGGATAKLARAEEHFNVLIAEIGVWTQQHANVERSA